MSKLKSCKLIDLPRFSDSRGSLGVIEVGQDTPFEVKRIYYLFDVPDGAERGVHAHKELQQLIIPISGSFDITLDDGTDRQTFHLDNPTQGILISNMIWRELGNFTPGTVCMVFASEHYDDNDYYHVYEEFKDAAK